MADAGQRKDDGRLYGDVESSTAVSLGQHGTGCRSFGEDRAEQWYNYFMTGKVSFAAPCVPPDGPVAKAASSAVSPGMMDVSP